MNIRDIKKYFLSDQKGATLIVLIVSLVCMSLLGTAMYTMTTTSTMTSAKMNMAQRAYYLAESCIRWMQAEYINDPVAAEAVYRNITDPSITPGGTISMGATNGNGQVAIKIYPLFGRYDYDASTADNLVLKVPGILDPGVFNIAEGGTLAANGVLWHNGGLLNFTAIQRVKNSDGTDDLNITIIPNTIMPGENERVAFTAQVTGGEVIVKDSDLLLNAGGVFLPQKNGVLRTIANINNPNVGQGYIKLHYKQRTGNLLQGISHYETEYGLPINQATLIAGEPLVLLPHFHYVATGTIGNSSSTVDGYLYDGKSPEDVEKTEHVERGNDLDNWSGNHQGDKGSFGTVNVDGDDAIKVQSLDIHGNNIHEASMTLDWSKTPINLKNSAEFSGGFLNYEIQTKIKQDPGSTDNSYLAGISFRVQKDGSQYGVSLFRPREIEVSAPDSIDLTGTIRDFKVSHIDMQNGCCGQVNGFVKNVLGPVEPGSNPEVRLPVYNNSPSHMVHGQAAFDQWYRDVPGVNRKIDHTITLTKKAGTDIYYYDSNAFFPIDKRLYGNQGYSHNYFFTYDLHLKFL